MALYIAKPASSDATEGVVDPGKVTDEGETKVPPSTEAGTTKDETVKVPS